MIGNVEERGDGVCNSEETGDVVDVCIDVVADVTCIGCSWRHAILVGILPANMRGMRS